MFNLFSSKSLVDANTIAQLLDEAISSRVKNMGLEKQNNYSWYSPAADTIRPGLQYMTLKGGQGTFEWGVCIDFIPTIVGNSLAFFKTEKRFKFHLFDWPDEYSNSFFGGQIQKGITTHWGINDTKKSIKKLFEKNENKIISLFNKTKTLAGVIDVLEQQIKIGRQYNLHWPSPKYVLAFLYAKLTQTEKALKLFDTLKLTDFDNNEELQSKARKKLYALVEEKNSN